METTSYLLLVLMFGIAALQTYKDFEAGSILKKFLKSQRNRLLDSLKRNGRLSPR